MTVLLALTHLLAAFLGGLVVRWWMLRHLEIREVDGHVALEMHHDERTTVPDPTQSRRSATWPLVAVLVACVLVITIGLSAFLDNRRRDAQDREANVQRERLASVQSCLNRFTKQLAITYSERATASARLEKAQAAKDRAADDVFLAVFGARQHPPTATEMDFDQSLKGFTVARSNLVTVAAQVAKVRGDHPLPDPDKAVCR